MSNAAATKPRYKVKAGQYVFPNVHGINGQPRALGYGGAGRVAYDAGGANSRYVGVWQPPLVSGDLATLPNIDNVSARAYDSIRNDPYLNNVVRIARDSIVGTGFRLRLHPDHSYLGISFQEAMDWARKAQAHFRVHADGITRSSDYMGKQTFGRSTQTQLTTKIAAGECVGIIRALERTTTRSLTCVQKIDPARLCNPMGQADNDRFRKGVELDDAGRPIACHFLRGHPNDYSGVLTAHDTVRIPLHDRFGRPIVLHSFNMTQVDMHRGISELVSALVPGRMLSEFNRVHLESAIAQSVFAATIKSDLNYADAMNVIGADTIKTIATQNAGMDPNAAMQLSYISSMAEFYRERAMSLNGAQVNHLAPHEELQLHRPQTINNGAQEFDRAQVRRVAAGTGSPVHNMSQDYQSLSYASGRIAETNAWRHYKVERDALGEDWGLPYASAVLEEEILTGRLPLPGNLEPAAFYDIRDGLLLGEFMSWGKPVIDPVKERKGQQLQLDMGATSLMRICDEEGVDLADIIAETAYGNEMFTEAGLPIPTGAQFSATPGDNDGDADDPDEDSLRDAGIQTNA